MPNQSGKIILVLVLILLILGAVVYFFLPVFKKQDYQELIPTPSVSTSQNSQEASKSSELTKNYYSKVLKISLKVPQDTKIEEKFTDLLIQWPNASIQVRRIGTNFRNINEYMDNLKTQNKITLINEEQKKINNTDAILITMKDPSSKTKILKEYSVYINNWVFKFSTSDEALYPVLDQIVQSFEYRP